MKKLVSLLAAGALLILAACSKDKDVDLPVPLTTFNATIRADKVWEAEVKDKHAKPLRLGLGLAVANGRVFAAGHKGEVAAFDLLTGRTVWRVKTKLALSGGPGAGSGLVVIGSTFGDLIALSETDGATRWKVRLNGEVLSAPAVSDRLIAVRTVDGRLRGISPTDGHELWSTEQQVPRLSLRGTSYPVLMGDLVLCGFDNGKVAAVNMSDGSVQWETTIAPSHGKTEIERLDDVDASVRVAGSDVYAIGFQGRVSMLALDTGQIWWSHDASSFRGLGLDDDSLYISTADGEIAALRRKTGTEIWRQKALLHRRLSAAVEGETSIVTADYQGYVHWLDKATGSLAARAATQKKVRISNAPVVVGNMVLVINDIGRIYAFRTTPIAGAHASAPADAGAATKPAAATPTDTAIQGASSDSSSPAPQGASGTATPPVTPTAPPAEPSAPATPSPPAAPPPSSETTTPPPSDQSQGPQRAEQGPAPASPSAPTATPSTPPPAPVGPQPATPPSGPEPSAVPPTPGTTQPPLPTQPSQDPLPPQPQTQPQPPPS